MTFDNVCSELTNTLIFESIFSQYNQQVTNRRK